MQEPFLSMNSCFMGRYNLYINHVARRVNRVSQLHQLHAHLIVNNYYSLHNSYVSLLARLSTRLHAPQSYVRSLMACSPSPDAHVFTSLLHYYFHQGHCVKVVSFSAEMFGCCGVRHFDAPVYAILAKSMGEVGGCVGVVHGLVVKLGHADDGYVRNAVMDHYAKYGDVVAARRMFDGMVEGSTADWNSMISRYWKLGCSEEARRLFDSMPAKSVLSWTTMVSGYAGIGDLMNARRYFEEMPDKNVVSWNAMISGYLQNGFERDAIRLFDEMENAGVEPNETTWVVMISLSAGRGDPLLAQLIAERLPKKMTMLNSFLKTGLIDMFAKCGHLDMAREIFDGFGVHKNVAVWNAMISGYTKFGDLVSARELFVRMPEKDVISWNSMITGYTQNGQSALAVALFKEMVSAGCLVPDELTIASVLSACGHLGALELGDWVISFLKQNHIELGILGNNALIFMYSRCGRMKDALRVFHEMDAKDVVSYNTLISGFAAYGQARQAIKLMSKMTDEGVNPDRLTFIGILSACSHAGLVDEGRQIFALIKCPSLDHYSCMVDLLGRAGKLEEAKSLIQSMPMEPHAGVYGSLLNACRIHGRMDLAEFAADKLFEIEPNNPGNYILLSNMYALLGRWVDVQNIREKMKEKGMMKMAGWSLVEHDGKLHKFVVGDRSHARSDDIYNLLADLTRRMRKEGYVADTNCVLRDVVDEDKEEMIGVHSEKLAVCFALLVSDVGESVRVIKNLRVCVDCHTVMKMISRTEEREIILRDTNRFHHFIDGQCSCNDYW